MPALSGPPVSGSILVIDDEPQIRRVVRNALAEHVQRVLEAESGAAGIDLAAAEQPTLIILDLGLPDQDGITVCLALRSFTTAPIVVLSARHSDSEKAALFDAGADDYVTKPFSTVEFTARIRAHLRRVGERNTAGAGRTLVEAHGVTIDLVARTVKRQGRDVHLTPTEWGLLRALVSHAGRTMTHAQLFGALWGSASGDAQQYLRVYVGQLRRKLEADPLRPQLIRTESAVGYRFEPGD